METIQQALKTMADPKYREFTCKLIPTVPKESVIGIRAPILRTYAKKIANTELAEAFLHQLPHRYLEENHLHAYLLALEKDFSVLLARTQDFLPHINNWATCDTFSPKLFAKHPTETYAAILEWISSNHTYTVRFAIVSLLQFFLDDNFQPEMLEVVSHVFVPEYYVQMAVALYFSFALIKQPQHTLPYFQTPVLLPWTHNKALQKAVESYRIPTDQKQFLKSLKLSSAPSPFCS